MSELITLSKTSPDFEAYLLGTFAQDRRALPVQTLNVNSAAETVTFRILPVSEISRPSLIRVVWQSLKARSFFLVLAPLLFVLVKNLQEGWGQ